MYAYMCTYVSIVAVTIAITASIRRNHATPAFIAAIKVTIVTSFTAFVVAPFAATITMNVATFAAAVANRRPFHLCCRRVVCRPRLHR